MVLVTELLNLTILVPELDKTSFLSHPRYYIPYKIIISLRNFCKYLPVLIIFKIRSCVLSQTLRPLLHEYFRREEKVEHGGSCSGCSVDSRRRPASKECHGGGTLLSLYSVSLLCCWEHDDPFDVPGVGLSHDLNRVLDTLRLNASILAKQ